MISSPEWHDKLYLLLRVCFLLLFFFFFFFFVFFFFFCFFCFFVFFFCFFLFFFRFVTIILFGSNNCLVSSITVWKVYEPGNSISYSTACAHNEDTDQHAHPRTDWSESSQSTLCVAKDPKLFNNLFVCVEVLRPSQLIRVMSSAVSLPNHTFSWAGLVL